MGVSRLANQITRSCVNFWRPEHIEFLKISQLLHHWNWCLMSRLELMLQRCRLFDARFLHDILDNNVSLHDILDNNASDQQEAPVSLARPSQKSRAGFIGVAFEELLGFPPDELEGESNQVLVTWHNDLSSQRYIFRGSYRTTDLGKFKRILGEDESSDWTDERRGVPLSFVWFYSVRRHDTSIRWGQTISQWDEQGEWCITIDDIIDERRPRSTLDAMFNSRDFQNHVQFSGFSEPKKALKIERFSEDFCASVNDESQSECVIQSRVGRRSEAKNLRTSAVQKLKFQRIFDYPYSFRLFLKESYTRNLLQILS